MESLKLVDFGLATHSILKNTVQKHSKKCGSPGYVAPEILSECIYDSKVDLFSAGIIMYIM